MQVAIDLKAFFFPSKEDLEFDLISWDVCRYLERKHKSSHKDS